eukprot:SAG31_NODE_31076_length_372_cov_1.227106_1_plen_82_part_01
MVDTMANATSLSLREGLLPGTGARSARDPRHSLDQVRARRTGELSRHIWSASDGGGRSDFDVQLPRRAPEKAQKKSVRYSFV